jgi:hypothetical protein
MISEAAAAPAVSSSDCDSDSFGFVCHRCTLVNSDMSSSVTKRIKCGACGTFRRRTCSYCHKELQYVKDCDNNECRALDERSPLFDSIRRSVRRKASAALTAPAAAVASTASSMPAADPQLMGAADSESLPSAKKPRLQLKPDDSRTAAADEPNQVIANCARAGHVLLIERGGLMQCSSVLLQSLPKIAPAFRRNIEII